MGKPKLIMRTIQEAIISLKPYSSLKQEELEDDFPSICHSPSSSSSSSVKSNRLFFSPSMTNSIMEEAKAKARSSYPEGNFYEDSVIMVVASDDPYMDFRVSMEEMIESHGLRSWEHLHELLRRYLSLNEEKDHSAIAMAFVDLVTNLLASNSLRSPTFHVSASKR